MGLVSGSGISPGGGRDNPHQYSCLENPMDRGAWQATVHRVTKSRIRLKWLSMHAWRRLLRVPWTARRSNQSILKEISPGISLEAMVLKLKLQYFGHLMRRVDSLEKTDAGRDWGQEEKGTTEDEMAGWHHRLDGREFELTPRVGDGQGGLACCNSWGCKELDTTERLNWTELDYIVHRILQARILEW